ncbi:MAG: ParA family protein [Bacteriovoracaceae bacterium]
MDLNSIPLSKVVDIFGGKALEKELAKLETAGLIPPSFKLKQGTSYKPAWKLNQLPLIGEKIGFLKKFSEPTALAIFTTKGGVLKSTCALNLARIAALHNLKTVVVGLDIQCDISIALGHNKELQDDDKNIEDLMMKMSSTRGLFDYFNQEVNLHDLILSTDLPNLFLIPETPELVVFNEALSNINRREYWIRDKIVNPLKKEFDLIILDCSPNWNKLTTNALVACDALISPLECKITNFRNFKVFQHFLKEFQSDMKLDFEIIYIPTRFSPTKKLSKDIRKWYETNLRGCTKSAIRESIVGEESIALNLSFLEYSPQNIVSLEMVELLKEIFTKVENKILSRNKVCH